MPERFTDEVMSFSGLNHREKSRVRALIARRDWLAAKTHDAGSVNRASYLRRELSATNWALEIIKEHFELINAG